MRFRELILAATVVCPPAYAHHPGGVGSPGTSGPINVIGTDTLDGGRSFVSLSYEHIRFNAIEDAALAWYAGNHQHVHSLQTIQSPTISLGYGFSNDLMVSLRMPWVIRTNIREGHHHHGHGGAVTNEAVARGDAGGIGDATVLAHWRFLNNETAGSQWAALFGVKAPTGATSRRDDNGTLFETEFQPGTGSWDGLVGLAVSQRFGGGSVHASAIFTAAGSGSQATNLGNRLQYGVAYVVPLTGNPVSTGPGDPMRVGALADPMYHGSGRPNRGDRPDHVAIGLAIDLVLELNGEWHDQTTVNGIPDENSGGNTLYLSPGLRVSFDHWSGFVSVGVPVVNGLSGIQAEPDWRLSTGVGLRF